MWEKRPMAKRTNQGDEDERLGQLRSAQPFKAGSMWIEAANGSVQPVG